MKRIIFVIVAVMSALFVSCDKGMKIWDEVETEMPVYVSFIQPEVVVHVEDSSLALGDAFVPIYCEMADGRKSYGVMNVLNVDVELDQTTAIEGVHYLLNPLHSHHDFRHMDLCYQDLGKAIAAVFTLLPKNIDKEVKLVLTLRKDEPKSEITKMVVTSRPNIETMTIIIKPIEK